MKKLLLQNRLLPIAFAMLAIQACSGQGERNTTQEDTAAVAIMETDTPDTPVAAPPPPKPEEKIQTKEIIHRSQDDKVLDSIKKEKAKGKSNHVIEIKHGSSDDRLLDSIKQSKRKGKG